MTEISTNQRLFLALVWILLSSIILSIPTCAAVARPSSMREGSVILEENGSLASENAPVLRYYLRKYTTSSQTLTNFTLKTFVEDSDGIDAVVMMYSQKKGNSENVTLMTQDIGTWRNVTMIHTSDGWYEATIPISNLSEWYFWCSYLVKYAANDTLGNLEVSPVCTYVFQNNPVTADWFDIYLCDTPDLWYVLGSTGHTVTWSVLDTHGQWGWPYYLHEDGHLIEQWTWSGSMTIGVDGLSLGVHTFNLNLQVALSERCSDAVEVHVVQAAEEIPSGAFTGSVGPSTEPENTTSNAIFDVAIPVLAVGISFAAVVIIWKKRGT